MTRSLVKRTAAFSETTIDGEVVLLNLDDGTFFSLTGTAAEIWPLIDGIRDRDALLADLAEVFGVAPEMIMGELDAFLAELAGAGFVEGL
jgi:Coenzyme PQQ synthesis protein D (PqqD)